MSTVLEQLTTPLTVTEVKAAGEEEDDDEADDLMYRILTSSPKR